MTSLERAILAFVGDRQGWHGEYEISGKNRRLASRGEIMRAMSDPATSHALSRLWDEGYLRRPPYQRPREPWRFLLTDKGRAAAREVAA